MGKSVPTLFREWQTRQKAVARIGRLWRAALARAHDSADRLLVQKQGAERAQDAAAKKVADACLDSRGRWRWDGEKPTVDLLRRSKQ